MKRLFIIGLLCVLTLAGCSATEPEILFDEASQGLVSVILQDYNDGSIHYDTVGPDGQRQPAEPFEGEAVQILTAAEGCFENHVENQPPNRLVKAEFLDESGTPAKVTEDLRRILELASQQEHVITKLRVLRTQSAHFVTAEWNVNFWDPHVLYYYDPAADALTELCTYDATQVIGLKTLNLK